MTNASPTSSTRKARRAFWLRQLYSWHWISAALCLTAMLLFAVTGITLNNAAHIEAKPEVTRKHATLPASLLASLKAEPDEKAPLPPPVRDWVARSIGVDVGEAPGEWSDDVYVALPRPGGDAWLSIDRDSGEVSYERTDRGWIAYLNDLHKGRHTGPAWSWFIDIFAAAAVVFSVTGLLLLQLHAAKRPATWPMVGAGLLIPVLLALLFIH